MIEYSLKLLGPFQLELPPAQSDRFESDKVRALLAILVTDPQAQRRETLATLLWPERSEQKARRNLSQALYNMRQVTSLVSEEIFDVTARTIQFTPNPHFKVDVLDFEQSLQVVEGHQHQQSILCDDCRRRLATAVGLCRGEFMAGLYVADSTLFEDWLRQKRDLYQRLLIETLRSLAHNSETLGDYAAALKHLQQVQKMDFLNEEICRQCMRLLALSGQRTDALRQYERFRQMLWDELGAEPEESTQSLYQHLLSVEVAEDSLASPSQIPGMLRSGDDSWSEAQTLEVAGEMARARGEYTNAKEFQERALTGYRDRDDRRGEGRSLSFLGLTARDTGDFRQARELIQQARQIYLELGDRFSGAEANTILGRLLFSLGEFSDSIDLVKAALPVYRDLGLQQRMAYFTVALATSQMMLGQYAEARTNAGLGIQLNYAVGDQVGISFGMTVLGMVAIAEENYGAAEGLLTQALVLVNRIGRLEELGSVLGSLGYLMLKKGNATRARLHLWDGLQVVSRSHNVVAALFVLPTVALYLKMRGESERARELFWLCKRFTFFDQSDYFTSLYASFLTDWDTRGLKVQETDAPVIAIWHAVDDLATQI
jgi:DNA-binding SARP family transcriptional activator